jgi:alkaline phosphatase
MFRQSALIATLSFFTLTSCGTVPTSEQDVADGVNTPKNIIMIVSDGMGPAYTTAYRNYMDNPDTPEVETVILDEFFVGNASTYPAPVSGYVTDSAAAATALASGVKSYNGAIGVDVNKQPVQSVMQLAKRQGMRTGLAVTSQIVHATPAAYVAHNESRQNYNAIADNFFDNRVNGHFVADVMLGGGRQYFEREDRDVTAEFIDNGYQYVDTYNKLATLPAGSNVLGLFAPVALPWVLDDKRQNRLAYMTQNAIKHLENDKGFFLLVEASQVDWAGHVNDIAAAMGEMHDLDLTLQYLKDYVKTHPDTLVVLTADHSTGGLTVGANGKYLWEPEWLKNLAASPSSIAKELANQDNAITYVENQLGFTLTDEEKAQINDVASGSEKDAYAAIKHLLDVRSHTGWTTTGHTGVDVEVFAFGAGSEAFVGQYDNTDIAKRLMQFVTNQAVLDTSLPLEGCDFKASWRCN